MSKSLPHPSRYFRWLLLLVVLGIGLGLWFIPGVRAFLQTGYHALFASDQATTQAFVAQLGWLGPLALIAGFVIQAVIPVLPALVLTAVAGRAYGPVPAFLIVYVGTLLGAIAGYWLGRSVGNSLVRLLVGEKARAKAYIFAEKYGPQGVLMVRLMPILSADALNLVAGAARMPFRPFLLATAVGTVPVTILVLWLCEDTQRLMWGVALLSAAVALVVGVRWLIKRRTAPPPSVPAGSQRGEQQ